MLNRRRNYRILRLNDAAEKLKGAGISNPFQEALWITGHALKIGSAEIFSRAEFSPDESRRIDALISRRINHEPLQYILGEADFYGRDFHVGQGVLIPRHDTETLIDGVKEIFSRDDSFTFLDWGTGSGCIAATVMLEFPKSRGFVHDISNDALKYARENLMRYGVHDRAEFGTDGDFDLIISNPPYIPSCEIGGLMNEVRNFEPHTALDGGHDGMTFYREIVALALKTLKHGGYIIFEAGNLKQVDEIETFGGFQAVGKIFDTGNFPRCIILRRG